jgi:hypothetical protein
MRSTFRAILIGVCPVASAKPAKIANDLKTIPQGVTAVDVNVQFKQIPGNAQHKKVTDKGGKLKTKLDGIKSGACSLLGSALARWRLTPMSVTSLPAGWSGSGVGVAVIDSGIVEQ